MTQPPSASTNMCTTHRGITYEWQRNDRVSDLPSLRHSIFYDLYSSAQYVMGYKRIYIEHSPARGKAWIRAVNPTRRLEPEPPEFDTPEQAMAWYFAIIKME